MEKTIICFCKNVDKETIIEAIKAGANSLQKIQQTTGACTGNQCLQLNPKKTCCSADIAELIRQYADSSPASKNHCCCR